MSSKYWRGRRVLVTGGSGFIGSHVSERLFGLGAIVTVAARTCRSRLWRTPFREDAVVYLRGDLKDAAFAARCARDQEVVFHFASKIAGLGYNARHPSTMMSENLLLDFQVLEAAARSGVKLFFYPSGALVYDVDVAAPTDETASTRGEPVAACKGAAWAKRSAEIALPYFREEFGMDYVLARLSNLYGPGDDTETETAHLIGNTLRKVAHGEAPEIWGDGSQRRAYLYVGEAVEAILTLVDRGETLGPINIGGHVEISVRDLVQTIIDVSGKELAPRFRDGTPTGLDRKLLDTARLTALTGFFPRMPLRDGLRRTYEWYLARHEVAEDRSA